MISEAGLVSTYCHELVTFSDCDLNKSSENLVKMIKMTIT